MCRRKKTIQAWAISEMTTFEQRLIQLVQKYHALETAETGNEIKRKWLNLCNENYAIQRRMVTDYIRGECIKEGLDEDQYQRQVGARVYPLFVNFINSFEYICELLYLNSPSIQAKLFERKERSFISHYRKAFKQLSMLTSDEIDTLKAIWDIRNAMHRNNCSRNAIDLQITDYETGQTRRYQVDAGDPIFVPPWGIDKITEVMANSLLKVIDNLADLEKTNITDIS